MSGRTVKRATAVLCLVAFFAAASAHALPSRDLKPESGLAETVWAWMTTWTTTAWNALTSTSEETPAAAPVVEPGADDGWLIDPNG